MKEKYEVHVILLAGGTGTRFEAAIPKQFVEVDGIPIIIYTLKKLQVELVSGITIVCVESWIPYLRDLIEKFNIKKVDYIVKGGKSGFDSTCRGFAAASKVVDDDDIIVIHDSVRPLLPTAVLADAVEKAVAHGNGCACLESIEGLVLKDNDECGYESADRYRVMRVQTPQAYKCSLLKELLKKADEESKDDFPYADGLCIYYGVPIFFSKSFTANTKITTRPDIAFMKAMMQFSDEELMGDVI